MNRKTSRSTTTSWPATVCWLVLLVPSIGLNLGLSIRLRQLTSAVASTAGPAVGMQLAPFDAQSAAGPVRVTFGPSQRPTILYYYSPSCAWCQRNWSNVRSLAARTCDRFRFIAVSSSVDIGPTIRSERLVFPVVYGVSSEQRVSYGFSSTPRTVVVSPEGRVLASWAGAYNGAVRSQIQKYFGVQLPGLEPAAP